MYMYMLVENCDRFHFDNMQIYNVAIDYFNTNLRSRLLVRVSSGNQEHFQQCCHLFIFLQVQQEYRATLEKLQTHEMALKKLFNRDQLVALQRHSTRGLQWQLDTIKKGLKLRFTCGSTGYNHLLDSGMPLPSVRTLQRRLQTICFEPGVLTTVFQYMKEKVSLCN